MKSTTFFATALMAAAQVQAAWVASPVLDARVPHKIVERAAPKQTPSTVPLPGAQTSHGCYSSGGNLTSQDDVKYVSSGSCGKRCSGDGFWVMALHGEVCYCGYAYPPADDSAKDSDCSYPCPGYDLEACGGINGVGYYSVFNTGVNVDVTNYKPVASTAASSSAAAQTSSATQTSTAAETSAPPGKKKSSNTAGIAAGVVVGVVVVLGAVGGLVFYMRRRRNAELEEDHRRNAAVNAFINGAKPPSSSGSISMADSRLDPVMANRRLSDGSIADNQDYSRRILRVTNA